MRGIRWTVLALLGAGCMKADRAPESVVAQAMDKAEMARSEPSTTAALEPPSPPADFGGTGSARGLTADEGVLRRPMSPRPKATRKGRGGDGEGRRNENAESRSPTPAPQRMVHYNGYLKLKVPNPGQTLQQVAEVADQAGGYVESLTTSSITIRVPVADFRKVYAELATLGDVLSRSLTAQDVTDQFTAMDLRVKTLRASRDRLIALLGKATRPREKLELLAEISRLTEEVDRLEMYLTTLASLAELSRLTVEAVPHQVELRGGGDEPIAAFRWIHQLSPFRRDVAAKGWRLALEPPAGMVELSSWWQVGLPWVCESADGAVIWASQREIEPDGATTDFWLESIRAHLSAEYGAAEVLTIGDFKLLRLVDQSEKAYRYLVGVRVDGDELHLLEIYYPGEEQEQRYQAAVSQAIAGGAL